MKVALSNLEWYKYKWCWIKNTVCNFVQAKNRPLSKHEDILIFSNGVVHHASKTLKRMKYFPQGLESCHKKMFNHITPCFGSKKSGLGEYKQIQTGYPTDILYFDAPPPTNRQHPNQKPVDLLEYLIRTYTNEGEVVLDCTMGSGSTGVACMNTGRKFIGFETEKKFFDIAEKRISEALALKQQELFSA